MNGPTQDITWELRQAGAGDRGAQERVWVALYDELRRLAHRKLEGERADHTLSTTALVHEAWLKLVDYDGVTPSDRSHFIALAARAMRQILVDYARHRSRVKRGGEWEAVPFDELSQGPLDPERDPDTLLALDRALAELQEKRERLARVVELRFFAGLSTEECAEVLDVSERTVVRDWSRARAYLFRRLADPEDPPGP